MRCRKQRVIERLRRSYPDVTWSYSHEEHRWDGDKGWHVYACSALAPRYDGDDDTFETQYRRSDTREVVFGGLLELRGVA